ncbi:MAG: hypothetical protein ACI8XD_001908 [Thermoproteota archaeon]|jgi:hypothetical protein
MSAGGSSLERLLATIIPGSSTVSATGREPQFLTVSDVITSVPRRRGMHRKPAQPPAQPINHLSATPRPTRH